MRIAALIVVLLPSLALAGEATVAVAANFRVALDNMAGVFEATTPHTIRIVSGSTGKLYAQIVSGAPFDLFLAADEARPALLEKSGHAVAGSRMTYATGRLALLVSRRELLKDDLRQTAVQDGVRKFAIANPLLAPYGVAAEAALHALGAWDAVSGKLVYGENVGHAFTMIDTGNAEAGFVALSTVLSADGGLRRAYLPVPADLHAPIRQDAVLLVHGADNDAAAAFLAFLKSDAARSKIVTLGYGTE